METVRKGILVVTLLVCVLGGSLAAYGYIFVTSNSVRVEMQYGVTLSTVSVVDSTVTLNAAVTNNGSPVRAGINVDFYYSLNGGDWTYFASDLTDTGGVAQAIYNVTIPGGYDFRAIVTVP